MLEILNTLIRLYMNGLKGIKNKIKDDNKKDTHEDDILDFEWFDENE